MVTGNHIGDYDVNILVTDKRHQIGDTAPMPPETIIARRMRELGLSQVALGTKIGQSKQQVGRWVSGERKVPVAHASALAAALNLPDWRMLYSEEETAAEAFAPGSDVRPAPDVMPPEPKRLPLTARVEVLGVVEAGADGQLEVNLTDGPIEEVDLPAALAGVPDLFALFVAGESMAAVWEPGDTVYVSRRRPITKGCYVVVEVESAKGQQPKVFLKQFVSKSADKVRLLQYNPALDIELDASHVKNMWRALHWREWAI